MRTFTSQEYIARPPDQITRLPKAPEFIDGVINLRGRVVPIVDLRRRFDLESREPAASRRILILAIGDRRRSRQGQHLVHGVGVRVVAGRQRDQLADLQFRRERSLLHHHAHGIAGVELMGRVLENARILRDGLREIGLKVIDHPIGTPIIPVLVEDDWKAVLLWRALYDEGVYTNVAIHPAVPPGGALLRTSVMATHDAASLGRALAALASVKAAFEAEHGPLPGPA